MRGECCGGGESYGSLQVSLLIFEFELPKLLYIALLCCGVHAGCLGDTPARRSLPLRVIADAPLSGQATRWDYASMDGGKHRLYIAHLGDSVVTVFDTEHRVVVKDIPQVSHVHGVLVIPELRRLYASATGTNEVVAIDDTTLEITARMPAGDYPDGIAYAPEVHKIYVSDERGATITVIDVNSNRRLTTIPLGGEAGNTQYDATSKHVFVNVQTRHQLVEIDPVADAVVARIDLPGAEGNHGLYIDAPSRLAFIACEQSSRLLVLDLGARRIMSSFDVAKDPDVLAFDAALGTLYVAGESGEVSILTLRARAMRLLGTGFVGPNAHVVAIDPATHQIFFPLKDVAHKPVLRIAQPEN